MPGSTDGDEKFSGQMLEATFGFARLALGNLILLNGAAAAAFLAFLGARGGNITPLAKHALLAFALGAAFGGFASMLAYFGQRFDWEQTTNRRKWPRTTNVLIYAVAICAVTGYLLFPIGCLNALNTIDLPSDRAHVTMAIPVLQGVPPKSPDASEKPLSGSSWRNVLTDPNVFFTACVAAFTLALVGVGAWQGFQLKRTVEATRQAAAALPLVERAYVFVRVLLEELPALTHEGTAQSNVTVQILNCGKTPAILEKLNALACVTDQVPTELISPTDTSIPPGLVLASGEVRKEIVHYRVSHTEWGDVENLNKRLVCFGRVCYRDVMGDARETGFYWQFQPHRSLRAFQIAPGTPLNYCT
jgi:hypothetical protein